MGTDIIPVEAERGQIQTIHTEDEMSVTQLVAQVTKIQQVMAAVMQDGVHYGVIPGTERKDKDGRDISKKTLLKPGAEKLCLTFRLDPHFEHVRERDGHHLTVYSTCVLYHITTGRRVGAGNGSCSTRENKYAWRNSARTCPECGKPAIIKGKAEYGGGWVCFKKKDGCGAKFADDAAEIIDQPDGKIENPDVADQENTVIKMADKRALIAAVLISTGASDIFTQDIGDPEEESGSPAAKPAAAGAKSSMTPKSKSAQSPAGKKDAIEKSAIEFRHAKVLAVEERQGASKKFYAVIFQEVSEDVDANAKPFEGITFSSTDADTARGLIGKDVAAEVQDCKQGEHSWTKLISVGAVEAPAERADVPF